MRKSLFPFIPFLLLVVPVLEIAVFILLGGQIGVINTLLGIVLTALIGTILLRRQGFALIGQAQKQMDQGNIPGRELAHGVMLLAAGLLLLTPGFVTDSFGFLLLVPLIRDNIFIQLKNRLSLTGFHTQSAGFSSGSFRADQSHGYYQSGSDTTGFHSASRSPDRTIIDLNEDDYNEVAEREAIESGHADKDTESSPWNKP